MNSVKAKATYEAALVAARAEYTAAMDAAWDAEDPSAALGDAADAFNAACEAADAKLAKQF